MKTAIVIGGGWAGLSAGVELADKGFAVTVLEQSKRLGGRASSFKHEKTGDTVDNGQHLMMGCYAATGQFLRKIGSFDQIKIQPDLAVDFADKSGEIFRLKCRSLPAPLHLASGMIGLKTLSFMDKLAMINVFQALHSKNGHGPAGKTVEEWMVSLGQSERSRRHFWDLITLATLNEVPTIADAESLAVVLKEAFFSSVDKSRLWISSVGLSDLCGPKSVEFITSRGGSVQTGALVANIAYEGDAVKEIVMRDGKTLKADVYVSSVPFYHLKNLLGEDAANSSFFSCIQKLSTSPIYSISLWFDRPIMEQEFAGLVDTETQWVFNKNRILSELSGRKDGYVTCVISGAQKFAGTSDEALLKMCLDELHQCFPASRNAALRHSLIVREKNATLSPKVGFSRYRLPQNTPLRNFFLCGDWTDTGLPATIESAVLSGHLAAEIIN